MYFCPVFLVGPPPATSHRYWWLICFVPGHTANMAAGIRLRHSTHTLTLAIALTLTYANIWCGIVRERVDMFNGQWRCGEHHRASSWWWYAVSSSSWASAGATVILILASAPPKACTNMLPISHDRYTIDMSIQRSDSPIYPLCSYLSTLVC